MDRAYEDFLSDRITDTFWTRHSAQWELEIDTIDRPSEGPKRLLGRDSRKDFRTREKGRDSLQIAESDRAAPTARNGAIELHVRPRKSQAYIHFAVRPAGERERNWKLAERVGFVPAMLTHIDNLGLF
jgi:hypothetical protein